MSRRFGTCLTVAVLGVFAFVGPVLAQKEEDVTPPPPAPPMRAVPMVLPAPPIGTTKPAPAKTAPEPAKTAAAEPELPPLAPQPPVDPEVIRLYLMDGSLITGKLSLKELPVETQFGKLTVPITSIKSFTPGLGSHPELAKDLSQMIKDLGSEEFSKRELAQRAILRQGPRVRAELERFANDADTERRTRIKAIINEFEEQKSADDDDAPVAESAAIIQRDTIETTEFTLVGTIVPKEFQVTSAYGQLTVKLSDIRRGQRDTGRVEEIRKSLIVDGTNIVQLGMKSAGIRLDKGDRVTVTAEGTLRLPPWGNQAQSSPDGAPNFGWYIQNSVPTGALIAQIGNGEVLKVGSKHTFTADRSGPLSFAIGMIQDYAGNQFPGKYTLKIRVEKK